MRRRSALTRSCVRFMIDRGFDFDFVNDELLFEKEILSDDTHTP